MDAFRPNAEHCCCNGCQADNCADGCTCGADCGCHTCDCQHAVRS